MYVYFVMFIGQLCQMTYVSTLSGNDFVQVHDSVASGMAFSSRKGELFKVLSHLQQPMMVALSVPVGSIFLMKSVQTNTFNFWHIRLSHFGR